MRYSLMMCLAAATWTSVAAAQSTGNGTDVSESTPVGLEENLRLSPSDVRVLVSVQDRQLWVVVGGDTLQTAKVSVASGHELTYAGRRWQFETPRGVLKVLGKRTDPVWNPPDWHYAEVASSHGLQLKSLSRTGTTRLRDGSRLAVRDSVVGLIFEGDTTFNVLPVDEHIVFDETLFIPPVGTRNRQLVGELGRFALDLGDGYMLHGTRDQSSIGSDTTHGCIRLPDEVLEWMYRNIPVGAKVIVQ
jgi:hypothetical protein